MADLQVPPAVGTSGQRLDTIVINAGSTIYRQTIVIGDPSSSGALAFVSSGGHQWIVSASSGAVQVLTSGVYLVTGTMSLSSGIVTLSSNPTVISASSGVVQVLTSGPYIVTGTVSVSSGVVTLSSNPTVISASSGVVQTLTSGPYIVTGTVSLSSGTVTLSSNPTVISASSGNVGTFASTSNLYSIFTFNASSSNSLISVTTAAATLYGWNIGNTATSAALAVRTYNSTTATVGSTTNLKVLIPLPGASAGAGNNLILPQGVSYAGGLTLIIAQNFNATSTGTNHSAGDVTGTIYYI